MATKINLTEIFSTVNFFYNKNLKHYGTNYSAHHSTYSRLTLNAHTCDFVAGSVMSIRNCFRPSNRLSEPTGSISVALKVESVELQVRLVPGQLNISCTLLLYIL